MNIKPELLTEISLDQIGMFIMNSDYGMQEKHNGKRRMIFKEGDRIYSLNKEGELRDLPPIIKAGIRAHPLENFIIDAELMDMFHVRVFDALLLGNHDLLKADDPEPFISRHTRLTAAFSDLRWITPSRLAVTEKEKIEMAEEIISTNAEGMVLRLLHASYRSGESRQHFKVKLVKTLDAVVMNFNREGKHSVDLGLYNSKGELQRICAASIIGKEVLHPNDVCEVKYLYGSKNLHIVQPRIVLKRDDKLPRACTLDQIVVNKDA